MARKEEAVVDKKKKKKEKKKSEPESEPEEVEEPMCMWEVEELREWKCRWVGETGEDYPCKEVMIRRRPDGTVSQKYAEWEWYDKEPGWGSWQLRKFGYRPGRGVGVKEREGIVEPVELVFRRHDRTVFNL